MNPTTAAETLLRIQATAAQGTDGDDGVVISDHDFLDLSSIARWLLAGAVASGEITIGRVVDVLPTVNLELLHRVAAEQAMEMHRGEIGPTCRALGVDNATFYRWRRKWRKDDQARANGLNERTDPCPTHGDRA